MCGSIPVASIPPPGIAGKPGNWKKLVKCPALRATFVGKCPAPHSYYNGQMPGPPVHQSNIQKY